MKNKERTKNDIAWERLFNEYNILEEVTKKGQFIIQAEQINKARESRLMAKIDHTINLPQIFRENDLSILPISRSKYIIASIDTHQKVTYNKRLEIEEFQLPDGIASIDFTNLYSEATALNFAFNAGIINQLLGEEMLYTVSGRMSTGSFNFSINSKAHSQVPNHIMVDNSQCEVDGGFEGEKHFIIIEVKKYEVIDFNIRQLYYPYRLWSRKLSKKVIPILMTFSKDIFDFFIYEFTDEANYNSLRLVQQRRFTLAPEEITRSDISALFSQIHLVPEPQDIPFPQANKFDRVVELLSLLEAKDLTKDDITANYQFDARQTKYYTDAAKYLGLVDTLTDQFTREEIFTLTEEARILLHQMHKQKYLEFIRKILEHVVHNQTFQATQQGYIPSTEEISQIIVDCQIDIHGKTVGRRASTVRSWINWIWKQIND